MSRLEKKCLFASTAMHGLALLLVVLGPAFAGSEPKPEEPVDLPILNFIPDRAVDEALFGGGSPQAAPQTQPRSQAPPRPAPAPRERAVAPPPRRVTTTPAPAPTRAPEQVRQPARTAARANEPSESPRPTAARSRRPVITPDLSTRVERNAGTERTSNSARAEESSTVELARALRELGSTLRQSGSSTTIEMPGPGGEAYANYKQIVRSRYFHAWIPPDEIADESATAQAKVVIARDGTVVSAVIQKRSGIPALDKSVERALQLDFIAPFPEGARDTERTFILNFNLKAKRAHG